jgi:hypothetical protein
MAGFPVERFSRNSSFPRTRDSRFVLRLQLAWIPAFAGMTETVA